MNEHFCETLLAAAGDDCDAEVFQLLRNELKATLADGSVKGLTIRDLSQVALRTRVDNRFGFAASSVEVPPQVLLAEAKIAGECGVPATFSFSVPFPNQIPGIFSEGLATLPVPHCVEFAFGVGGAVERRWPRRPYQLAFTRTVEHIRFGVGGETRGYSRTIWSMDLKVADRRGLSAAALVQCDLPNPDDLLARLEGDAADIAEDSAVTGKVPVVLTPTAVRSLFRNALAFAFRGNRVHSGIGHDPSLRIASPLLTLKDDGTLPARPQSKPFDDEGVLCRSTDLIADGFPVGFLLDRRTASLMGLCSTGNGTRLWDTPPTPMPHTFVVAAGEQGLEEMVRDIREGLLVLRVEPEGDGSMSEGRVSARVVSGRAIRGGRLGGRVKGGRIQGLLWPLLADIKAVGNDQQDVLGDMRTPSLLLGSAEVR